MMVYVLIAVFPVLLGYFFPQLNNNKTQKKQFYLFCGTVLLFVMGFRHYSLGSTDTLNYYNAMRRAVASSSLQSYLTDVYEVGSQLFIYLLSRIFEEPQWLLIVTSAIYIISVFYFVDRNCDDIPMSISVYITFGLFAFHMQGMRQSLAMCICLFAYEQAKKRHLFRFILILMFAMAFHQTAILFAPIYFLIGMRYSRKNIGIMLGASAVVLLFADRILSWANNLFDRNYISAVDSGGVITLFINILIILIILLYDRRLKEGNEQTPFLFIAIICALCYAFRYVGSNMAARVSYYFAFAQIALVPRTKLMVVAKQMDWYRLLLLTVSVVYYIYHLNATGFLPYKFFWQV